MTSTASSILRLELIGTGEQAGQWGITTNTNLGTLVEGAIAGMSSVSVTSADQALVATDYATDQARMAILTLTTTTTAAFNVYAPPVTKTYTVYNASSYTATIYNGTVANGTTAAGTGVTIAAGERAFIYSDGTNFYKPTPLTLSLSTGTAAAPSLSFSGDSNTGIYSSGLEQVSVALNGSQAANFSTSGLDLTVAGSQGRVALANIYANASGPLFQTQKARGTSGSPAIVQNNDELATLYFLGYDGANYQVGAKIVASVDGVPGVTDMPGRVSIYTTPDGSGTPAERVRVTNAGYTGINNTAPVTYLDVAGPAGVTSFTGTTRLGVTVRGATGATDYGGIDFVGGTSSYPTARIGVISTGSGASIVIGTSNNYTTGITNSALTINESGNATFTGTVAATGALSTQSTLAVGSAGATATVSGSAPLFFCRAWVSFSANGGTITVNGSGNVTSVTYNGAGDYTINFTTALPNANYAVSGVCANWNSGQGLNVSVQYGNGAAFSITTPTLKTTTQLRVVVGYGNNAAGIDGPEVNVMVFC